MQQPNDYIISGGEEGKKRLSVLSGVLDPYTRSLLEAEGPITGKHMLDLGCGGGNVALMAAELVGKSGSVTGIDFDGEIISLAKEDAAAANISNITFKAQSAYDITFTDAFDIVYSRFLLSHLRDPATVLKNMVRAARPGGRIVAEDVQFSGHFCFPECHAFDSYLKLYTAAAKNNGHDPEIGPVLFELFHAAGIKHIGFDVIQPCFSKGPGKWMGYITMEKIRPMLLKQGLADAGSLNKILEELEAFTKDERTLISLPRIFRVWGYKP